MSRAGIGSRRANEELIAAGRVRVNGRVARLGHKADPVQDVIEVDDRRLKLKDTQYTYIILHKPKGVISSLEDELDEGRPTVRDLVDYPGHLYPVGRLDKQSEGLILMTNDGRLTHRLTHPRFGHEKQYLATVEGKPSAGLLEEWRQGVMLDGRRTAPAEISVVRRQKENTLLHITLREGRKRQIRRIAAMLGHPVIRLVRTAIGPIELGELKAGQWRHLTKAEVKNLKRL